MSEELLYYIWQQKLFSAINLKTTSGEPLSIIHSGVRNKDAGPDFTGAKIRINDYLLAGNIEIHVNSSDWKKHRHQHDKAFSNVILHVVYNDDEKNGSTSLPTLEMKDKIEPRFLHNYEKLMLNQSWIPCEQQIREVDSFFIRNGMHRLVIERLEQKTKDIAERLAANKNSWEETFYQLAARNFGLKVNADAFDNLVKSLPLKIIAKHKNSLHQIEALLFGQAGMLESSFEDDYPKALKKEFRFLRAKYNLQPMQAHLWKFMRLRPPAFPTVRLAQFSSLLFQSAHLFSKVIDAKNVNEITLLFQTKPSEYWLNHYRFDAASKPVKKVLGKDFVNTIIINTVIPVMFIYGKAQGNQSLQEKAISFLEQLSPEKNSVISKWRSLGIQSESAYTSQALLQLKNNYCSHKRCLHCFIGHKLFRSRIPAPR